MFYQFVKNTVFLAFIILFSISGNAKLKNPGNLNNSQLNTSTFKEAPPIIVGANRTSEYLGILKDKRVGIVGNQTSVIFNAKGHTHIVDSLLSLEIAVKKVFSPEHGFRGTASAGEVVKDDVDDKTGLPIISLYGEHKKPTAQDLENIDILIFDIQDVGLRFYTYISTLHYIMQAAAEHQIPVLIFDRPNPNGDYLDGPVLEKQHTSFVGLHPVPTVHGMTIGEYAQMINGEGWLSKGVKADLHIIKMENYTKDRAYSLPIPPSPNLPNDQSINLYPSLCFFEGTNVNAGRGTDYPFQVFGSPDLDPEYFNFQYTPKPNAGTKDPKHKGELCYGKDLQQIEILKKIHLQWLITAYEHTAHSDKFFNSFFTKLAGTTKLQDQIEKGEDAATIRTGWKDGLEAYDEMRHPYLLY